VLPYIVINGKRKEASKLLIDSGATNSYLNPELIEENRKVKLDKTFIVKIPIRSHGINESIKDVKFQEFPNEPFDFYLFHFHSYFDGILGMDILRRIGAKLDLQNLFLETKNRRIPVQLRLNRVTDVHLLEEASKTNITLQ